MRRSGWWPDARTRIHLNRIPSRAKEIRAEVTRQMDLWERGLHTGLVGDAEAEGAVREGRAASGGEE